MDFYGILHFTRHLLVIQQKNLFLVFHPSATKLKLDTKVFWLPKKLSVFFFVRFFFKLEYLYFPLICSLILNYSEEKDKQKAVLKNYHHCLVLVQSFKLGNGTWMPNLIFRDGKFNFLLLVRLRGVYTICTMASKINFSPFQTQLSYSNNFFYFFQNTLINIEIMNKIFTMKNYCSFDLLSIFIWTFQLSLLACLLAGFPKKYYKLFNSA